ncbi:calpain-7 [Strigomonas culicis]|uniref:Calpain-7 n=1 Tax=Strigomonas culicis TaxID=28005 RepID=S9VBW7_9TRYP|nr:calpain-7 [Strigomonas culicis]|eukprot:EPY24506.1 calpain-7 [Strigomonas culicis]
MSSTVDYYKTLCASLGLKPLRELITCLEHTPSTIDVSNFYFPKKHLVCILTLVQNRSDIKELILDEVPFSEGEITTLTEMMQNTQVHVLSLRNVKLSIVSGEEIKNLCKRNKLLTTVFLQKTSLPDDLIERIKLVTELNKIGLLSTLANGELAVKEDYQCSKRFFFESLCYIYSRRKIRRNSRTSRELIAHVVENQYIFFVDSDFIYSPKINDYSVRWIRIAEIVKAPERDFIECSGSSAIYESKLINNKQFFNALEIIQQNKIEKRNLLKSVKTIGLYTFAFFMHNKSIEVTIDDSVPFTAIDGNVFPLGIYSTSVDFWGCLIEKAFAKLIGGYEKIGQMSLYEVLSFLTGGMCFNINWPLLSKTSSYSEMFQYLRNILSKKQMVSAVALPKNTMAEKALFENGIVPDNSYTILDIDIYKDGNCHTFLIQLISPHNAPRCKKTVVNSIFDERKVNSFSIFWINFDDFITIFEESCLLIWPSTDPMYNYKISKKSELVSTASAAQSSFAKNPIFLLENAEFSEKEIVVSVHQKEGSAAEFIQLHFFKTLGEKRRYTIAPQSALFCSKEIKSGGSVLFTMIAKEKMQVVVSSSSHASCTIEVTSLSKFNCTFLDDHYYSSVFNNKWVHFENGCQLPSVFYCFKNISNELLSEMIINLTQGADVMPPFPISVIGWIVKRLEDVDSAKNPDIVTEKKAQVTVVFRVTKEINPDEIVVLLPRSHSDKGSKNFDLTVFSPKLLFADSQAF